MRKKRHSLFRTLMFVALFILGGYLFLFYGFGYLVNFAFSLRDQKRVSTQTPSRAKSEIKIEPSLQDVPYATNTATITVSGIAMPDATIVLYRSNRKIDETKSDFDGNFSFSVSLDEGTNSLAVSSKEESGRDLSSRLYSVRYMSEPPKLEMSGIEEGKTYTARELTIKGSVPNEVFVMVNGSPVVVRADGSFEYDLFLKEGDQTIVVSASDVAGNETLKEYRVTYKKQD